MKQIRHGVFETNSSSTHSLTVRKTKKLCRSTLVPDGRTNKLLVELKDYGWSGPTLKTQQERLSYLATMFMELEGGFCMNIADVFRKPGYMCIASAIKRYTGLTMVLEGITSDFDGVSYDGHIDHQSSTALYGSVADFLATNKVTVEEFIFGDVEVKL